MLGLSNCEKIRTVMKPFRGERLETARIRELIWKRYPDMPAGSNVPSEHAGTTNATQCGCAGTTRAIFTRVTRGLYEVRSI